MAATRRARDAFAGFRGLVAAGVSLVATLPAWSAPPAAARIEVHSLTTLTLTRTQLLDGSTDGAATTTIACRADAAWRRRRRRQPGRLDRRAQRTRHRRLHARQLQRSRRRGRDGVARVDAAVGRRPGSRRRCRGALALLSKHPRIDPARIAVMGFSSGGRTVLAMASACARPAPTSPSPPLPAPTTASTIPAPA